MPRFTFHRTLGAAALILLALAVWRSVVQAVAVPPRPAVESGATIRVAQTRCAECHSEIVESFASAPHALTLHRATESDVLQRFLDRTFRHPQTEVEYHYDLRDGRLFVETDAFGRPMPIDWVFGSGTHAQTPLIVWNDEGGQQNSLEHLVSWYPDGSLAVTLGQGDVREEAGLAALGRHWGGAETVNCFGCHSAHVPTQNGAIVFDELHAGIGCARCHWETDRHVLQMERGETPTIERFSQLSPRDSIDRCGECHRRAEEFGGPLAPEDETLARFAPVGLSQSPCFLQQSDVVLEEGRPARLDCTTCHDPHGPSSRDWTFYTRQCLTCHDAAHGREADCPRAARNENCLTCHMSKTSANDHLQFTDHWIRVRDR